MRIVRKWTQFKWCCLTKNYNPIIMINIDDCFFEFLKKKNLTLKNNINYFDNSEGDRIKSNIVSTIYMRFINDNKIIITWNYKDFVLCMYILIFEISLYEKEIKELNLEIHIDGQIYKEINEEFFEYIYTNRINFLILKGSNNILANSTYYVRTISDENGIFNPDDEYLESKRDIF